MIYSAILIAARLFRLIARALFSRLFIFIFMLGLFIASHTLSFVADLTFNALRTASQLVTSQPFSPKSPATLQAENRELKRRSNAQRRLASQNLRRVQERVRRTTLANIAATGGEALPFFGVGIIAGATAYEVKSGCDTMNDLYELQREIDPSQANAEDRDRICGLQVPTSDELWASIKSAPGDAWDTAVQAAEGTADWAKSLERPDFGPAWRRIVNEVSNWFR